MTVQIPLVVATLTDDLLPGEGSEQRCRRLLVEDGAWALVEFVRDTEERARPVRAQVRALGEVVAKEAVGVLVRAALPRRVRITEVDQRAGRAADLGQVPGGGVAVVPSF